MAKYGLESMKLFMFYSGKKWQRNRLPREAVASLEVFKTSLDGARSKLG